MKEPTDAAEFAERHSGMTMMDTIARSEEVSTFIHEVMVKWVDEEVPGHITSLREEVQRRLQVKIPSTTFRNYLVRNESELFETLDAIETSSSKRKKFNRSGSASRTAILKML